MRWSSRAASPSQTGPHSPLSVQDSIRLLLTTCAAFVHTSLKCRGEKVCVSRFPIVFIWLCSDQKGAMLSVHIQWQPFGRTAWMWWHLLVECALPDVKLPLWRTSLNIGQTRVAESCHHASLSLCGISPGFQPPWQTAALWLSAWVETPLCTPDWLF